MVSQETLTVAHNFKRLRTERNLSVYELAELGNVSPPYIWHIESSFAGKTLGRVGREKWAKIFKCETSEFHRGIDNGSQNTFERELELLNSEVSKLSLQKIRKLRALIPVIFNGK